MRMKTASGEASGSSRTSRRWASAARPSSASSPTTTGAPRWRASRPWRRRPSAFRCAWPPRWRRLVPMAWHCWARTLSTSRQFARADERMPMSAGVAGRRRRHGRRRAVDAALTPLGRGKRPARAPGHPAGRGGRLRAFLLGHVRGAGDVAAVHALGAAGLCRAAAHARRHRRVLCGDSFDRPGADRRCHSSRPARRGHGLAGRGQRREHGSGPRPGCSAGAVQPELAAVRDGAAARHRVAGALAGAAATRAPCAGLALDAAVERRPAAPPDGGGLHRDVLRGHSADHGGVFAIDRLHLAPGAAARTAGIALTAVGVGLIASQLLVRRLDWPPLRLIRTGAVVAALGFGATAMATTPTRLAACYFVAAAGMGWVFPAFAALAANAVEGHEPGGAAGWVGAAQGLGIVLGPLAGTLLCEFGAGVPYLLVALLLTGVALWPVTKVPARSQVG